MRELMEQLPCIYIGNLCDSNKLLMLVDGACECIFLNQEHFVATHTYILSTRQLTFRSQT